MPPAREHSCTLPNLLGEIETRGQFNQLTGTKHKCTGARSLAQKMLFKINSHICAKLYQYTQLEIMPNFYTLRSTMHASKISENLLA